MQSCQRKTFVRAVRANIRWRGIPRNRYTGDYESIPFYGKCAHAQTVDTRRSLLAPPRTPGYEAMLHRLVPIMLA